jgi:ubiquitin-conjugating enzyme E2 S
MTALSLFCLGMSSGHVLTYTFLPLPNSPLPPPPLSSGFFFELKLVLSSDFPNSPPRGFFLTKIYHPNVNNTSGDICVNTLKKDWTPSTTVSHVLSVIRCLLIVPFPESSLNDEAGKLFMDSYDEYARRAKLMAGIHARRVPSSAPTDVSPSSAVGGTAAAAGGADGGAEEGEGKADVVAGAADGAAAVEGAKVDGAVAKKSKDKAAEEDKKKAAKKKLMRL